MGVVASIKKLMPVGSHDDAPLGRQHLNLRRDRRELADAIRERNAARKACEQAAEQLANVEGHASACAAEFQTARKRAADTAEAVLAFQREQLARGQVPPQDEARRLAADAAAAAQALVVAERAAEAAETAADEALPSLREKDRFAHAELDRLEELIRPAVQAVARAELDRQAEKMFPSQALKQLRDFHAVLVAADRGAHVGLRPSDVPIAECRFSEQEIARAFRDHDGERWRAWAEKLREDAEASF